MEKTIISQIAGGLGNQLFQYAFARKLAIETGASLLLDVSFYKLNLKPKRHFELDRFSIHVEILADKHLDKLPDEIFCLDEAHSLFYEEIDINRLEFPLYITGYRQSWKYFNTVENQLKAELRFETATFSEKMMELGNKLSNTLSVGIHIRRTDYGIAINHYLGILPNKYYDLAVKYFKQISDKFRFYIFSDDPEWAEVELELPAPFQVMKGNTGFEDFYLMSQCQNNIIANSSYSWWAAWLNPNPSKIVVVPGLWETGNNLDVKQTDLIPPEWVCIW